MIQHNTYDYDITNRYEALVTLSRFIGTPLQIKYSASGKLHIKTTVTDKTLAQYDEARQSYGNILGFYLLFDIKFGRLAGKWIHIRNLIDLMNFLY